MRVTYSGKSAGFTDREREYAEKKLQRLARYFNSAREAHLYHDTQRNWQTIEVQIDLDGLLLRAQERTPDIFASIDAVTEKLEKQITRLKGKMRHHKGRADAPTAAALLAELPNEEAAEDAAEDAVEGAGAELNGSDGSIVTKRKRIAIKPMTAEQAALQMDLLNHDFFAFTNAESGQAAVLYRRSQGGYGLLELET